MRISDFGHDSSDSENDDALLADIQALSKACYNTAPVDTAQTTADSSDSDEDVEFLRDVQKKYGGSEGADPERSSFALPVTNSDSDDDDFEILRAIQKRFGQYSSSGTNCVGVGDSPGKSSVSVQELLSSRVSDRVDENDQDLGDSAANDDDAKQRCALAFIDAIRKNRLAQKHLRSQMTSVESRMDKVKEMIKRVKVIWEFDMQEKRKMVRKRQDDRVLLISVPNKDSKKLHSAMKSGPPENSWVVNYRNAFKQYPQWISKERWTKEDRIKLRKGVIQQLQKYLLLKSMERMNESEELESTNGSVDEIMSKIGNVQDPHTVRSFLPNLDWEDLAANYLPKRSGSECKARWKNFEDTLINHDQNWTRLEDKCLLDYVQQLGYNWVAIAESLGTNRTAYQCLTRYQRSLNRGLMNREWTPAQDAELTAAVQTYGESNWTVVASVLEGRAAPQCSNRWLKTLLPSKQRKGRWNSDEDKRLKIAVMIMGSKCWNKIADFVPGRTQARCRDRWMNNLDPSLNLGKWTDAEDAKLEDAIRVHGTCWAKIATYVRPRTDSQCRRRWIKLFPDEAFRAKVEKKAIRDALPSNFVDREPNRPTLEANDFTPLLLEYTVEKKTKTRRKLNKVSETAFCNIPKKARSRRRRRVDIRWENPVIHHKIQRKSQRIRNKCAEADSTATSKKKSMRGSPELATDLENLSVASVSEADSTVAGKKKPARGICKGRQGPELANLCAGTDLENLSVASVSEADLTVAGKRKPVRGRCKGRKDPELANSCAGTDLENLSVASVPEADSTVAGKKKPKRGSCKKRKDAELANLCAGTDSENLSASVSEADSTVAGKTKLVRGSCKKRKGDELANLCAETDTENLSVASVSEVVDCSVDNSKIQDGDETIMGQSEVSSKKSKKRRLSPEEPAEWEHVPLTSSFVIPAKLRRLNG